MKSNNALPVWLLGAALASTSLPLMAAPDMSENRCERLTKAIPAKLSLQANFHESITLPMPLVRVAVAQPDIADVSVVGQDNLLVLGKKPGATGLLLWSACSAKPLKVQVNVQGDSAQLTAQAGAVGDAMDTPENLQTALLKACRLAIEEDGAESIVIGGGPLAQAASAIGRQLGVEVIDPVAAAVRLSYRRCKDGLQSAAFS